MHAAELRAAASQLTAAADHLDSRKLQAGPGATAFNWQALLATVIKILIGIAPYLTPEPVPAPPPPPPPPAA
jgi:hypothetical protein